jgi:hypothetical protein
VKSAFALYGKASVPPVAAQLAQGRAADDGDVVVLGRTLRLGRVAAAEVALVEQAGLERGRGEAGRLLDGVGRLSRPGGGGGLVLGPGGVGGAGGQGEEDGGDAEGGGGDANAHDGTDPSMPDD